MPSSYSPDLRFELIGQGEQDNLWGITTNNNLGELVEQAICGVTNVVMTNATTTLTALDGTVDQSRSAILNVTSSVPLTAPQLIVAPAVSKVYVVANNTSGGQLITVVSTLGGGFINVPNGGTSLVYCDGTNFLALNTGSAGNFRVAGNLTVTGTTALTGALTASTAAFSGAISSVNPVFTGIPTAPTASAGTNTTQIATTAFVQGVAGALGTMSTQNANAVNITGGTLTGMTNVAGGTHSGTRLHLAVLYLVLRLVALEQV